MVKRGTGDRTKWMVRRGKPAARSPISSPPDPRKRLGKTQVGKRKKEKIKLTEMFRVIIAQPPKNLESQLEEIVHKLLPGLAEEVHHFLVCVLARDGFFFA
jgi:hypothetical protein